ncbi:MAG: mechanosensitive ion channel family protein [Terrabacter sp.]
MEVGTMDTLTAALTDMWRSVAVFVPKFIAFLLILLIGWFIAKAIGKVVDKILERVGFDRAVERGGIKKALERSQYDASTIVGKLIYYALLLFVLQLAFGVFGPNPISDLIASVIAFLPRAIVAIIIIVVAAAIAAAVRDLIANALGGLSYGKVLANIASVFILGLGIIAALNQVGIATTVTTPILIAVLATIAGILIVGVGGGLVRPMQSRWEQYLERMSEESGRIREHVRGGSGAPERATATSTGYETGAAYDTGAGYQTGATYETSPGYAQTQEGASGAHLSSNDPYGNNPPSGSTQAGEAGYDPRH